MRGPSKRICISMAARVPKVLIMLAADSFEQQVPARPLSISRGRACTGNRHRKPREKGNTEINKRHTITTTQHAFLSFPLLCMCSGSQILDRIYDSLLPSSVRCSFVRSFVRILASSYSGSTSTRTVRRDSNEKERLSNLHASERARVTYYE